MKTKCGRRKTDWSTRWLSGSLFSSLHWRLHRIHDVTQRLLKLSRESLLSLSSQFIRHSAGGELQGKAGVVRKESTSRQERPRTVLDNQALLVSILSLNFLSCCCSQIVLLWYGKTCQLSHRHCRDTCWHWHRHMLALSWNSTAFTVMFLSSRPELIMVA